MAHHLGVLYHLMHETSPQAVLLVLLILLLRFATKGSGSKKQARLPPSPPGLPLIGHLHLGRDHVSLCNLAKKHGSDDGLMLLRRGTVPHLVVSSPGAAKAIMRTHGHLFASRPTSMVAGELLYGPLDVVFAPYGEHWRQARKLATMHLLSLRKVQSYRLARRQEVRLVMAVIREAAATGTAVDMSEMMNTFAYGMVCGALSGKFIKKEGRNKMLRELIEANTTLFASFNLENCFPRLAWLTRSSVCSKAKKVNRRWDDLLEKIIQDHEKRSLLSPHGTHHDAKQEEGSDFIDVLLSVRQQEDYEGITREHIKAILMDMFAAGTDTSSFALEVAMAEIMRNPRVMTKLQAEVRNGTPKGQDMVEEENLANMAYLKAVVKETLRLHPPLPLLIPHSSMLESDVDVAGYTLPSGAWVMVNTWAINRDPGWWEKPEEFLPERFMEGGSASTVDFRGNDFQFLPFGAGRRICPGMNFGLAMIEIMLANLVYGHDWELPSGIEKNGIDMTEVFRLSVRRKEKLMLVPKTT
ncbi:indole-2-monooxygenase-like [Hordeum vulgare subsp. vulgare]|uniref:indole-2-monooxygenase-like n=1 Tax=Hordeum vulgare subsp. vulgare TaxID=112509 RepID=UPI00162D3A59|nr:indole-2-monooxygenase-like [Hordeum vulgare subsp. vulgare]